MKYLFTVAPLAGAWIETYVQVPGKFGSILSHPSRVRGLKQGSAIIATVHVESHPSRVRGLKRGSRIDIFVTDYRRTLHGCVD
jgi:hypothetical protein